MRSAHKIVPYLLVAFAALGIGARLLTLAHLDRSAWCGADFPVFYAGGKLATSPELYSADAIQSIHNAAAGCASQGSVFIRLPFFAGLMWPLAQLPFSLAFTLWRLASIAAAGIFIWLWKAPRLWSLVACAWSFPLAWTLTNGQDVAFLLAWLAISLTLLRAGAPFAAGLVLSLCAAKFHLFVLLPLLIVSHRLWRLAAGLAAGGSALLAISFALQGKGWPAGFWHAIRDPRIDLSPDTLPNLRGLTHGAFIPHLLLAVLVVVAVFLVCRRAPLELGLAAVLAGGLLLNPHVTSADGALLIPAALASIFHPEAKPAHFLAILLLTPLPHIFNATPALSRLAPSLILAFVLALAYSAATGLPAKNSRIAAATRSQA